MGALAVRIIEAGSWLHAATAAAASATTIQATAHLRSDALEKELSGAPLAATDIAVGDMTDGEDGTALALRPVPASTGALAFPPLEGEPPIQCFGWQRTPCGEGENGELKFPLTGENGERPWERRGDCDICW